MSTIQLRVYTASAEYIFPFQSEKKKAIKLAFCSYPYEWIHTQEVFLAKEAAAREQREKDEQERLEKEREEKEAQERKAVHKKGETREREKGRERNFKRGNSLMRLSMWCGST